MPEECKHLHRIGNKRRGFMDSEARQIEAIALIRRKDMAGKFRRTSSFPMLVI